MNYNPFSNNDLSRRSVRGFTLIELLVVISIIGMLSSVVLVSLQGARDKGQVGAGLKFATYNYHALGDNLFVRYDFNEASGAIPTDYSGNSLTTAFVATAPTRSTSYGSSAGSALVYVGTGGVSIGQSSQVPLPAAITIAVWVKTSTLAQNPIFSNRDVGGPLFFGLNGGGGLFHYETGVMPGSGASSNKVINDNKWHHVTWTTNGTTGSFYIDGKLDSAPYTFTGGSRSSFTSASAIAAYLGKDGLTYFTGSLDDLMIFKKELVISDIERLYAAGLPTHTLAEAR